MHCQGTKSNDASTLTNQSTFCSVSLHVQHIKYLL